MPTIAVLAIVAIVAVVVGIVWYATQSRSTDMFGFGRSQTTTATQQRISPAQYQADFVKPSKPHVLVDVRTPEEFASGHVPGAINISLQSLPQRMQELPKDQPIVLYCRSGNRSHTATQLLARAGYTNLYDLGGIIAWTNQGLPIQ
jgi:rhodanese-related sulfurtransferase